MDIVIIGSGNAATVLGREFRAAGHRIVQIISRNASAASELAYEWDTESANYLSLINRDADVYIIAVSDDSIEKLVAELKLPGKVVAHTAASISKDVLKKVTEHYGVFYPLQSLRKDSTVLPVTPFFIDGSDELTKRTLKKLASSVSREEVATADDDERLKLHVAAVILNNFINHLYTLVEDYCKKEGIDFRHLVPLIEETAGRLERMSPSKAQTGPAVRGDLKTIEKHLQLLEKHPALKSIYETLTASIRGRA